MGGGRMGGEGRGGGHIGTGWCGYTHTVCVPHQLEPARTSPNLESEAFWRFQQLLPRNFLFPDDVWIPDNFFLSSIAGLAPPAMHRLVQSIAAISVGAERCCNTILGWEVSFWVSEGILPPACGRGSISPADLIIFGEQADNFWHPDHFWRSD